MEAENCPLEEIDILKKDQDLCEQLQKLIPELLQGRITNTKDFLIGTDNNCIYIKSSTGKEAVIKIPRYLHEDQAFEDKKPMHHPFKQAWILELLKKNNCVCPDLIYVDPNDKFLIEKFVPEKNYLEAEVDITKENQKIILDQLGQNIRKMHQIKSSKYGYLVLEKENEGSYETWSSFFDRFEGVLEGCEKQGFLKADQVEKLRNIRSLQTEYLANFNDPCILHADLCTRNFLVHMVADMYHLSAIIDFANIIAGDPCYDIGNLLCELGGDLDIIPLLEKGYFMNGGAFKQEQRKAIIFYAIWYCLWNLYPPENDISLENNTKVLYKLIDSYFV